MLPANPVVRQVASTANIGVKCMFDSLVFSTRSLYHPCFEQLAWAYEITALRNARDSECFTIEIDLGHTKSCLRW